MTEKKWDDMTLAEIKKLFPFDQALFEKLRDNDRALYEYIFRLPEREIPYIALHTLYGGRDNEHVLMQQLKRMDKSYLSPRQGNKLEFFRALIPDAWELEDDEELAEWFYTLMSPEEVDAHYSEIMFGDNSHVITLDGQSFGKYGNDDEKLLDLFKIMPSESMSYDTLTKMYGETNVAILTEQLQRLQRKGKLVKFQSDGKDYYRAVTPASWKEMN
jgi:hypothetical protein